MQNSLLNTSLNNNAAAASSQDVDVENVDRASRRQQALAKSTSARSNNIGSMDVDVGRSGASSNAGAKPTMCKNRCTAFICSTPFCAKMSCLSMTVTCSLLLAGLIMVANVLAMNPYTVFSSQIFQSTEFISLSKTIVGLGPAQGGVKMDVWLMIIPESVLNQTFLISDSVVKGDGVNFISGSPGMTYSGVPMYFALDSDRTAVNIYKKNEGTRASSASNQHLLDVGADDTWLYSIPLHADNPGVAVTVQGEISFFQFYRSFATSPRNVNVLPYPLTKLTLPSRCRRRRTPNKHASPKKKNPLRA